MKNRLSTYNKRSNFVNSSQSFSDDLEKEIHVYTGKGLLPPMTPDLIDDFITWAYPRFDLYSFSISKIDFKIQKIKEFLSELPAEDRQFKLKF